MFRKVEEILVGRKSYRKNEQIPKSVFFSTNFWGPEEKIAFFIRSDGKQALSIGRGLLLRWFFQIFWEDRTLLPMIGSVVCTMPQVVRFCPSYRWEMGLIITYSFQCSRLIFVHFVLDEFCLAADTDKHIWLNCGMSTASPIHQKLKKIFKFKWWRLYPSTHTPFFHLENVLMVSFTALLHCYRFKVWFVITSCLVSWIF